MLRGDSSTHWAVEGQTLSSICRTTLPSWRRATLSRNRPPALRYAMHAADMETIGFTVHALGPVSNRASNANEFASVTAVPEWSSV